MTAPAAQPDDAWLDITLIQPRPYRNWALLVIDQGYDAAKQKRATLPFNFLQPHAGATLLLESIAEHMLGKHLSHSLAIYTIELLDVDSVELLPRDFDNLPKGYVFKDPLIAHKPIHQTP
jgi:hypothetical protein